MSGFFAYTGLLALTPAAILGWVQFGAVAIFILAILIVVHEFGHFIVARALDIPVQEFALGFGKKLYGRKYGETEYQIRAVPLGGYVKFFGDDPEVEGAQSPHPGYSFLNEPVSKRLPVVAAGPLFNIFLAVIIYTMAATIGWESPDKEMYKKIPATLDSITKGGEAEKVGLKSGDTIEAVDGVPTPSWVSLVEKIVESPGKPLTLTILRAKGGREDITATPKPEERTMADGTKKTVGLLGVSPRGIIVSYPVHEAFVKAMERTWQDSQTLVWVVGQLLSGGIPAKEIAGPIGIMQIGGEHAKKGLSHLLVIIGLISINLAVINLLPIPILDGGHIMFALIEAAMGKPLDMRHQEIGQQVGMALILALMVLAFYNDFARLFGW